MPLGQMSSQRTILLIFKGTWGLLLLRSTMMVFSISFQSIMLLFLRNARGFTKRIIWWLKMKGSKRSRNLRKIQTSQILTRYSWETLKAILNTFWTKSLSMTTWRNFASLIIYLGEILSSILSVASLRACSASFGMVNSPMKNLLMNDTWRLTSRIVKSFGNWWVTMSQGWNKFIPLGGISLRPMMTAKRDLRIWSSKENIGSSLILWEKLLRLKTSQFASLTRCIKILRSEKDKV